MKERTLVQPCSFEGKGLHTGKVARMTISPAAEGSGIRFLRSDLGPDAFVDALAVNVSNTARSTTLTQNGVNVITVEHILSALTGLGIDNALISLDNEEIPILDGSAKPYCEAIVKGGIATQNAERKYIELSREIVYEDAVKGIKVTVTPTEKEPSYAIHVDFGSQVVGIQDASWTPSLDYAKEIAPCRTFVFFHEIEYLYKNNLIKGGDIDNAIVIVEHPVPRERVEALCQGLSIPVPAYTGVGYLDNMALRFENECARHKMLDLLGDLRLCGGFLKAEVKAVKTGHFVNSQVARMILENKK
ncbi:MAG: UDP-3-O-acyl-N-acetylglucosamine deacetylase [Bacteroidales bacterium]|nr:UDP-3-O-acyl-N-acetylglucosamine deacetylase [Bacteroidales bacterium]